MKQKSAVQILLPKSTNPEVVAKTINLDKLAEQSAVEIKTIHYISDEPLTYL